jgi:hypothetical protein
MTHPLRSRAVVVDDDNLVMVQFVLNNNQGRSARDAFFRFFLCDSFPFLFRPV